MAVFAMGSPLEKKKGDIYQVSIRKSYSFAAQED
jgi:hypothetical protein